MTLLETRKLRCPYCGEVIKVVVDCSMEAQTVIEDCQVCCRPIALQVDPGGDGELNISAHAEDDADY